MVEWRGKKGNQLALYFFSLDGAMYSCPGGHEGLWYRWISAEDYIENMYM